MAEKKAKIAKRIKKKIVKKYNNQKVLPVRLFYGGRNKMFAYYEKNDDMVTDTNGQYVKYKDIQNFTE